MNRSHEWGALLKDMRRHRDVTRDQLAAATGMDSSYIWMMEKEGRVPAYDRVLLLADELRMDRDVALLYAGYAPELSPKVLAGLVRLAKVCKKSKRLREALNALYKEAVCPTVQKSGLSAPDAERISCMPTTSSLSRTVSIANRSFTETKSKAYFEARAYPAQLLHASATSPDS